MKRFFALLALVLGMVSCQTEPEGLDVNVGGEQDVNITVSLPEGTRANSALGAFENVNFEKYDVRFQCEVHYGNEVKKLDTQYSDNGKEATFSVRLVPNRNYTFVVWADLVEEDSTADLHYNTANGLVEITLNNTWVSMDETRDAFTCSEVRKFARGESIRLELTRPFAKLRVVTTDMLDLMGIMPSSVEVEYTTTHFNTYNALTKTPSGELIKEHEKRAIAAYDYAAGDATKTLFTDYFFATETQKVVNFNMNVYDQNGEIIDGAKSFNTPIPAKRNYVTTIKGNVLTYADDFTVEILPGFDNAGNIEEAPYYQQTISSAAEFLAALNANGEFIVLNDIVFANAGDVVSNGQVSTLATRAGKTSIIDLNGHTITVNNKSADVIATIEAGNKVTIVGEGTIELTSDAIESFIENNGVLELANVNLVDNDNVPVIEGDVVDYADLLRQAFAEGRDYQLVYNVAVKEPLTLANGKTMVLDLNGKTIYGYDNATASFGLINNKGNLTVKNGTITLEAKNNRAWSAYSSVISNNPGGNLVVENATIEHFGGTDMAYGIDNLTNGKGTYAETTLNNGAVVKSVYRAVRQFLNGVEAQNILTVNAGAVIEGANKSIWMQDPSANANTGMLVVEEGATLNGDVYLFVTDGSAEWPVEISIADSAFAEGYTVVTGNVPAHLSVVNKEGIWTIESAYEIDEEGAYILKSAAGMEWFSSAVKNGNTFEGKTVKLGADIDLTGVDFCAIGHNPENYNISNFKGVFDGNNKTISGINRWDSTYASKRSVGLFARVENAVVKNLKLDNFVAATYGGEAGAIACVAVGDCLFENLTFTNGSVVSYNNDTSAVVGWANVGNFTFKNINIADSVTIFSLWDSYDTSLGGVIGTLESPSTVKMENVNVACVLNAFSDACANYQWFAYRRTGMLIGNMSETQTLDERTVPDPAAAGVTCENVTVTYGDWMNYHYCEFEANGAPSYASEGQWKYSRVEGQEWGRESNIDVDNCTHDTDEEHNICLPVDQLFGGGQGVYGLPAYEGVTVNYPASYVRE